MSLFMERIQCLKAAQTPQGDSLLLTTKCPRGSWNSFDRPWKNERLSQTWSHPRPLLHYQLDLNIFANI